MKQRAIVVAGALALAGCATSGAVARLDRPLLSVETRLSCAIDAAPAETATRGPRRGYDGEAMPSAPAPASADADVDGVTPRRSCTSSERLAALMLAMPEITASVDATGAVALIESAPRRTTRQAPLPPGPAAVLPPVGADRAVDAATRLAQLAPPRARPPR